MANESGEMKLLGNVSKLMEPIERPTGGFQYLLTELFCAVDGTPLVVR